jgi:hypothetical protein
MGVRFSRRPSQRIPGIAGDIPFTVHRFVSQLPPSKTVTRGWSGHQIASSYAQRGAFGRRLPRERGDVPAECHDTLID